ncbi:hypothetical protein [Streptomyces murinus]|uniref:hypothetical protein n=1 Tax=Streptomyces murinus TaxID=33900 RepID=UPI00381EC0F9
MSGAEPVIAAPPRTSIEENLCLTASTPPESAHELWVPTLDFTRANAALALAHMMGQGVRFVMPPQVAALPRLEDRAGALAAAERERLSTADLYYFDAAACKVANTVELRHQAVEQLLPSPAGFLVWEESPMYFRSGIPIRAASWGVAYDGGTWASWWSDTQVADRLGLCSPTALGVNGLLTYHEEVHLPPQAWPVQVSNPDDPAYGMFCGLFGAWTAIDTAAVDEEQVAAPARVRKQVRRHFQLEAPPVRSFTPSATGGTVKSPQTIVRRTLAGLVLDRPYPQEHPAELAPWHCYLVDGGHCLLVVPDPSSRATSRLRAGPPASRRRACRYRSRRFCGRGGESTRPGTSTRPCAMTRSSGWSRTRRTTSSDPVPTLHQLPYPA